MLQPAILYGWVVRMIMVNVMVMVVCGRFRFRGEPAGRTGSLLDLSVGSWDWDRFFFRGLGLWVLGFTYLSIHLSIL